MDQHKLTSEINELISIFRDQQEAHIIKSSKEEPKLIVHETIGKAAFFYEKIRRVIDYQEEHLIKKNAFARMLKRRIIMKERGGNIAEPLLRELIRAGYLKNNYFPIARIKNVETLIAKYANLVHYSTPSFNIKKNNKTINWIISVAAAELEEFLNPSIKEDSLVETIYKKIRSHIDLSDDGEDIQNQDIQIYIAIHRAIIKTDPAILRYHLIYYYTPEWRYMTPAEIPEFSKNIQNLINIIEYQINSRTSEKVFRKINKFSPLFSILKDVLNQNSRDLQNTLTSPDRLDHAIQHACQKRYAEASTKLGRGVIRSIIYIFLTKTILAFIVELPYELFFLNKVVILPLAINVVFHPILMTLIATSISVPTEKNTKIILQGIKEIVYDVQDKEIFTLKNEKIKTSAFINFLFSFIYLITFIITFGGIIWLLITLKFNFVSILLFMFFLSAISFFGLRLRHNATELVMVEKRQNIIMILFEFLSLPIIRVGSWLAKKTSKINIFMFIMDFVIEAPFKVITETIEEWVAYQKEKKDEIF